MRLSLPEGIRQTKPVTGDKNITPNVAVEITPEMIEAGAAALDAWLSRFDPDAPEMSETYRVMLAKEIFTAMAAKARW